MSAPNSPRRGDDSIDQYLGDYYNPVPNPDPRGQDGPYEPRPQGRRSSRGAARHDPAYYGGPRYTESRNDGPKDDPQEKKSPLIVRFLKTISFYAVVVLVCLFVNFYVVRLGLVNGSSMEPTLTERDVVIIWQPFYTPAPGDIVVTDDDNMLGISLTKRVIATGGQHLLIENGAVYVDGAPLSESYLGEAPGPGIAVDMVVPDGHVFLMGDNRNASFDSREMGAFSASHIMGKVVLRIYPFNRITTLRPAEGQA